MAEINIKIQGLTSHVPTPTKALTEHKQAANDQGSTVYPLLI